MSRLTRVTALTFSAFLFGACAQIIGLSDYEEVDEEDDAGENGGGSSGRGGSTSGGSGGKGGNAGSSTGGTAGATGGSAGQGGTTSGGRGGSGGDSGAAGEGGQGGAGDGGGGPGGEGGSGGDGGSAGNPGRDCTEVAVASYRTTELAATTDIDSAAYYYDVSPELGSSAVDEMIFEFWRGVDYDGEATGTFVVGSGIDADYESCARCVLLLTDNGAGPTYLGRSGTMEIASDSAQMIGYPDITLTDVTLEEVTIDPETLVSTPVEDGSCIHFQSFVLSIEPEVPAGWTCGDAAFDDGYCDCGCGAVDADCTTSDISACTNCALTGSCALDCSNIDPQDNSVCTTGAGWTCAPSFYRDEDCDCGCGVLDPDCAGNAAVAACEYCWCDEETSSCPGTVDPLDNSQCVTPVPAGG